MNRHYQIKSVKVFDARLGSPGCQLPSPFLNESVSFATALLLALCRRYARTRMRGTAIYRIGLLPSLSILRQIDGAC